MTILQVLQMLGYFACRILLLYAFGCLVFPIISLAQEYKVWKPPSLPSLTVWGMFKVYIFNVLWMGACLISALLCLPKFVLTGSVEYASFMWFETYVACGLVRLLVGHVEIRGIQHLPPFQTEAPAPVYIANHSSQLDAAVVYYLNRRFKWIAKSSVFYVPGVGPLMYLSGHVFINRKSGTNKSSIASLYAKSNANIQSGVSMFFFPQGTRNLAKRLPFKDGAFNVAMENHSELIPISIEIPTSAWNHAYPFFSGKKADPIIMTVHPSISSRGKEKQALKQTCFDTIYSCLPTYTTTNNNNDDDENDLKKKN